MRIVSVERRHLSRLQSLSDVFLQKNNIKAHLPKLIHLSLQFKPLLEAVAALICLRVQAESVSLSVTFVPNCVALHPS